VKALSLSQPWASLITCGAKRIETRSWGTDYRGPLAIHAAKGFSGYAREFCYARMVGKALGWPESGSDLKSRIKALPIGAVIATTRLVDCLPMEAYVCLPGVFDQYPDLDTPAERAFGNFDVFDSSNGRRRWAWILEDVRPMLPEPATGERGLWEWQV